MSEATHESVRTTDLFWVGAEMFWRIHLTDGRRIEVSDAALKRWLKDHGEKIDAKISYRKFARYAMST